MTIANRTKHRAAVRAAATRSVLEKTDRLLGWDGRVRVIPPEDTPLDAFDAPPGWTNGKTITVNATAEPLFTAMYEGFDVDTTMLVTALNYHELAHCFFTPRLDSDYVNAARNQGHFFALNVLEDQAAESRFVRLYSPARHYFTRLVATYLAESKDRVRTNYVLVSGRRFLPADLRRLFRQNFALPHRIKDVDRIVAEYCNCVWPDDSQKMLKLVGEMHQILEELRQATGQSPSMTSHHGDLGDGDGITNDGDDTLTEGELLDKRERRQIARAPQIGEDITDEPVTPQEARKDEEAQDKAEGRSEAPEQPQPAQSKRQSEDEGEEEGQDQPGAEGGLPGGSGAGQDTSDVEQWWGPDDLDELTKAAIEDASDAVYEEVQQRQEAFRSKEADYRVDDLGTPFDERPPEAIHTRTSREVEKELLNLNQRYKPGWHRRQETGKIDTNQISNIKRGRTDVFKRWNEGVNNAVAFESVLLLDMSGSMYSYLRQSSEAIWMLHRALKNVGAEVTVLGYTEAERCHVLLNRGVETPKVIRDYHTGGATYVMPALNEALRIFAVSRKPLKVMFIVTDGHFSDPSQVEETMRKMDVPTAMVGINYDVSQQWPVHKIPALKVSRTIREPHDLVPLAQKFVMSLARERYDRTLARR